MRVCPHCRRRLHANHIPQCAKNPERRLRGMAATLSTTGSTSTAPQRSDDQAGKGGDLAQRTRQELAAGAPAKPKKPPAEAAEEDGGADRPPRPPAPGSAAPRVLEGARAYAPLVFYGVAGVAIVVIAIRLLRRPRAAAPAEAAPPDPATSVWSPVHGPKQGRPPWEKIGMRPLGGW